MLDAQWRDEDELDPWPPDLIPGRAAARGSGGNRRRRGYVRQLEALGYTAILERAA